MNYMCLFTVLIVKQKPQQDPHPVPPHNDYFVEYYTMVMLIVKETTTTSPTPSTTI